MKKSENWDPIPLSWPKRGLHKSIKIKMRFGHNRDFGLDIVFKKFYAFITI